eukprot:g13895.t1
MYIEQVEIDGFKSYATAVTVGPFDKQFNAITGLNGTGKSNILDSICFVLGIQQLANVRVKSLDELVYKQGQAGVTKASVTITFNNEDRDSSPLGFEEKKKITVQRLVVIGGRNKYLINNVQAQQAQVANLFHSVKLNVNNPHFLIMQGRIMKVINMKPHETLSMIEEAAGTKMYENKRQAAVKNLERKEGKIAEINRMLEEEIAPTIRKLETERANYLQWAANNSELERLQRFTAAHDYWTWTKNVEARKEDVEKQKLEKAMFEEKGEQLAEEGRAKKKDLEEREAMGAGENNVEFQQAKEAKLALDKVVQTHTRLVKSKFGKIDGARKDKEKYEAKVQQANSSREKKAEETEAAKERLKEFSVQWDAWEEEIKTLEKKLAALSAGRAEDEAEGGKTLQQQLVEAQEQLQGMDLRAAGAKRLIQHNQQPIKDLEKRLKDGKNAGAGLAERKEALEKQIADTDAKIKSSGFSQQKFDELWRRCEKLEGEIEAVDKNLAATSRGKTGSPAAKLIFNEGPEFRQELRKNIFGTIGSNFRVKPEFSHLSEAMSTIGGAQMSQLIVRDQETQVALLKKGVMQDRKTLVTWKQGGSTERHCVSNEVLARAKKLAQEMGCNGGVWRATDCIEMEGQCPVDVRNNVYQIFAHRLIVEDQKLAEVLPFAKEIELPCVTTAGDDYNSQGKVTGGGKSWWSTALSDWLEFKKQQKKSEELQNELDTARQERDSLSTTKGKMEQLLRSQRIDSEALKTVLIEMEMSDFGRWQIDLDAKKAEKKEAEEFLANYEGQKKELAATVERLKAEKKDQSTSREEKQTKYSKQISDIRKLMKPQESEREKLLTVVRSAETTTENFERDLQEKQQQAEEAARVLQELQKELDEMQTELDGKKLEQEQKTAVVDEFKKKFSENNAKCQELKTELQKLEAEKDDVERDIKKLTTKIRDAEQQEVDAKQIVERLLRTHSWIASEKHFFGRKNSDYDFEKINPQQAKRKHKQIEEQQRTLGRSVNKKVMSQFESATASHKDLVEKRDKVVLDKKTIDKLIATLDKTKQETLRRTWKEVNQSFGHIFGTVLPGSMAKLEPPEGQTEQDGLEICVGFSGTWKKSLVELSGGQKSLLSLSLILALLRYNPAPMYILDEVDAALDLSHTQNIGRMIKEQFPDSQFIIVSLKEGMFDNANVLFRTSFERGCSQVERTTPGAVKNERRGLTGAAAGGSGGARGGASGGGGEGGDEDGGGEEVAARNGAAGRGAKRQKKV